MKSFVVSGGHRSSRSYVYLECDISKESFQGFEDPSAKETKTGTKMFYSLQSKLMFEKQQMLNACDTELLPSLCASGFSSATGRATRMTSPLWLWTPETGRWSPLQTTRARSFTSTSAGRWCSREVSVCARVHYTEESNSD